VPTALPDRKAALEQGSGYGSSYSHQPVHPEDKKRVPDNAGIAAPPDPFDFSKARYAEPERGGGRITKE
jgi:hypothetical protein